MGLAVGKQEHLCISGLRTSEVMEAVRAVGGNNIAQQQRQEAQRFLLPVRVSAPPLSALGAVPGPAEAATPKIL